MLAAAGLLDDKRCRLAGHKYDDARAGNGGQGQHPAHTSLDWCALLGRGLLLIFVPRQILSLLDLACWVRRRFASTDDAAIQLGGATTGSPMCRGLALLWLCIMWG